MANFVFDLSDGVLSKQAVIEGKIVEIFYYKFSSTYLPFFADYSEKNGFLHPAIKSYNKDWFGLSFQEFVQERENEDPEFTQTQTKKDLFESWISLSGGTECINIGFSSQSQYTISWALKYPFTLIIEYDVTNYSPTTGVTKTVFTITRIRIPPFEVGKHVVSSSEIHFSDVDYIFPAYATNQSGKLFSTETSEIRIGIRLSEDREWFIGTVNLAKGMKTSEGYITAIPCFGSQILV